MSVINSVPLIAAGDDGYQISRSVRLRSSASAYFNRTFSTPTDNKKWTWSAWVKRGTLGAQQMLFQAFDGGANRSTFLEFFSDDTLRFTTYSSDGAGSYIWQRKTAQVFRDPSAWYHITVIHDTANATAADRAQIWINGVRVTSFGASTDPTLNQVSYWNANAIVGRLASWSTDVLFFDGYLTEVNFIDGQALTPSSFGETDAVTGVWKPKKYAGTYGINGFYLNFSDNSAATAAAIGKDYSGNGNNWTPNNISVTAGVTYDSMLDVPTMWADGGNGRGNYCTLNPLNTAYPASVIGGNLSLNPVSVGVYNAAGGTIYASSGKWYWEITITGSGTGSFQLGATNQTNLPNIASGNVYSVYYAVDGSIGVSGTNTQTGLATYTWNDVVGVAYDATNNTVQFYKNGASVGAQVTGVGAACTPLLQNNYYATGVAHLNCGQRPFAYTPPTGFLALNTQNLPDATIKKGNQYFDVSLFTGTGSAQTITNSGAMQPDLVWIKGRGEVSSHRLVDSVRGVDKVVYSNLTNAETTEDGVVDSFNSNGFTGGGANAVTSGYAGVAWQWKESVSAGFDIVTYTGDGSSSRNLSHSLGVAPSMAFVKIRNGAGGWGVWHKNLASSTHYVYLHLTEAQSNVSSYWNGTWSSTQFGLTNQGLNTNGSTYVAYLFAEVAGYSKFGSYTGNGSTDGPFVFCGFRPRYVLWKCSSSDQGGNAQWGIVDTSRNTSNVSNSRLNANSSGAEDTNPWIDILSNGFKVRETSTSINANGATYIYMAFAENPFKNSLAR